MKDLDQLIEKLIIFISQQQKADGSFSGSTFNERSLSSEENDSVVFYTALILRTLSKMSSSKNGSSLGKRGTRFLLDQKSPTWTWNYFKKDTRSELTLPDDLDDTFISLSAISCFTPELIDEAVLAQIIRILVSQEEEIGGPYFTWIVSREDRSRWNDIDIVVMTNIKFFLDQYHISHPHIERYIDQCIENEQLSSKYYHSEIFIIYFISQSYTGVYRNRLRKRILKRITSRRYSNPLELSCSLSAFLRLGGRFQVIHTYFFELVSEIKNAPEAFPLFIEKIETKDTEKGIFYSGSRCFTAACFIETVDLYQHAMKQSKNQSVATRESREVLLSKKFQNIILKNDQLPHPFKKIVLNEFDSLRKAIPSQFFFLPEHFSQSLHPHYQKYIQAEKRDIITYAHLFGWIGYTLFDNVMDHNKTTYSLPSAIYCIRMATKLFGASSNSNLIDSLLDQTDTTYFLEKESSSHTVIQNTILLPKEFYLSETILSHKSMGAILGCLLILDFLPKEINISQIVIIESFFKHFLTARQLNDDAHDWFIDLQNGKLTSTCMKVLEQFKKRNPEKTSVYLNNDSQELHEIFWSIIIISVVTEIGMHTAAAQDQLSRLTIFKDTSFLSNLLQPLSKSIDQILTEQQRLQRFLKSY